MRLRFLILALVLSACVETFPQKINTISGPRTDLKVTPPPACPNWTKVDGNGGSNFGNTLSSNYGCATVTNFGAMVDDPYDMIEGKSSVLTNAARSGAAVSTYESGGGAGPAAAPAAASSAP